MITLKESCFLIGYGLMCFGFQKVRPLFKGIIITDSCNLRCRHCTIYDNKVGDVPFNELKNYLRQLYDMGIRIIYLQGGEPFLWQDKNDKLESIIQFARTIGFFRIYVCTNGTYLLNSSADIIWVSIDGLKGKHDLIRGKTFDTIMRNIDCSSHKNIRVQTTLNMINYSDLAGLVQFVDAHPKFKGILFNLHVPYPGTEDLYIDNPLRSELIDTLIELKQRGAYILNTFSALRALKTNSWKRPLESCLALPYQKRSQCESTRSNRDICKKCGYGATVEAAEINKINLPVIYHVSKMLFS